MENQWLAWAKRLEALASTGTFYATQGGADFDVERYREIGEIARAMLAALGDVPLERLDGLLSEFGQGYATPKIDVRGAVIADDHILLVREKSDGLWTMPGGFADVGISGAENVVKEIWEEANIRTAARTLIGVRHKAKHAYHPDPRDFYKLLFLCERRDDAAPRAGPEVHAVDYFPRDRLPPLSRDRIIEADIDAAFEFHADPTRLPIFD